MKVVVRVEAEEALLVVKDEFGMIVLLEYDISDPEDYEFAVGLRIYNAKMARGAIRAIRKISKELGWEV